MDRSENGPVADRASPEWSDPRQPSFGQCLADCTTDHYGLTGLLGRGAVGAAATPFPKSWVGASPVLGAGPNTNLLRAVGHSFPSLNPRIGVRILGTRGLLGILGRAMPGVGAGLLAYDAGAIGLCTYGCLNSDPQESGDP